MKAVRSYLLLGNSFMIVMRSESEGCEVLPAPRQLVYECDEK